MEGLKIIIADDEALIRLDLREMLTEAGHTVLGEASDGEEAVELARANSRRGLLICGGEAIALEAADLLAEK